MWPDWRSAVEFSDEGPAVTVLHESSDLKVVLVGLEAGQGLPAHPGPAASFHFLDGHGLWSSARRRSASPRERRSSSRQERSGPSERPHGSSSSEILETRLQKVNRIDATPG